MAKEQKSGKLRTVIFSSTEERNKFYKFYGGTRMEFGSRTMKAYKEFKHGVQTRLSESEWDDAIRNFGLKEGEYFWHKVYYAYGA